MAEKKGSSVSSKPAASNVSAKQPASKNTNASNRPATSHHPGTSHSFDMFNKDNYLWMLAGLAIIALGMFLMSGGKSNDPNVFDQKEVYSTTRITIAPLLIILGLGLEVFAIFRKKKD